jgi:indole-3-glycerol phosphate synthase/phosphoribosylanthranilate isomerase
MALDSILKHKREELGLRMRATPLAQIKSGLERSERSLAAALGKGRSGFILECKRMSPSRGEIRRDYDPAKLAPFLAEYADAISVLTDERFFGGKLADARAVSGAVSLPVLMKDFLIDPFQVYEGRAHGADAILMIVAALDDETCGKILDAARELNMDVLVEVHDEGELARALKLDARIIGINSRNLKTLEVDLGTFERLAPLVPGDRILVAESGVKSHADVRRLSNKADAFLVGSSIMEQDDVARASREIVYGRVKVCGLTRPGDARSAEESGATYGGLIFAAESPRRIDVDRAREIMEGADLDFVGVFANEEGSKVASAAGELKLSAVQLHGEETDDYIAKLKGRLPEGCEVWKAHRVRDALPNLEGGPADRILLDAFEPDKKGGTGQSFDWSILAGRDLGRVILSGGLGPENAGEADLLGAYALDVNSGVESAPGKKDRKLIDAFFSNLRGGGRRART